MSDQPVIDHEREVRTHLGMIRTYVGVAVLALLVIAVVLMGAAFGWWELAIKPPE